MLNLGFKFGDEFLLEAEGLPPIRICLYRGDNTGARSIGLDAPGYQITRVSLAKPEAVARQASRTFPTPATKPSPRLSTPRHAPMLPRPGAERRIAKKEKSA